MVLPLRKKVYLGVLAMKEHSPFFEARGLEPFYPILFSDISTILAGLGFYPSTEMQVAYSTAKADRAHQYHLRQLLQRENVTKRTLIS